MRHCPWTRIAPVLLLFALSSAAHAQPSSLIRIVPPGPTTRTPVELVLMLYCEPRRTSVMVSDFVIEVQVDVEACGEPPYLQPFRVRVPGLLESGQYRVRVRGGGHDVVESAPFIVRDADPRPLTVAPFAVPSSQVPPIRVRISAAGSEADPLCIPDGPCRVTVDGVDAADEKLDAQGNIWFTPPPHAPGLATVRVDNGPRAVTAKNAMYYFDRDAPPEPSIFERILFPLLLDQAGANGSRWLTEATISNPMPTFVENYNEILPFVCVDYPCGERLGPGELVEFQGGDYPRGVALLSPRTESPNLAFALRVRDVSRAKEGYGTEIPVVRESEMYVGTEMTMLEVPLMQGYRAKLRVYTFDPHAHTPGVGVRIVREDGSSTRTHVTPTRTCTGRECAALPHYAELDLPQNLGTADVYVQGEDGILVWAFISVTNNETQQVTLVTPDGNGGHPCVRDCGGVE